jgi:hypothetical protein
MGQCWDAHGAGLRVDLDAEVLVERIPPRLGIRHRVSPRAAATAGLRRKTRASVLPEHGGELPAETSLIDTALPLLPAETGVARQQRVSLDS